MSVLIQKSNIKDEVFGNYTIIPNWLIEKFKYDELAVLTYMLSKPTDWTFNKVDIAKQIGMSREKLNKILLVAPDSKFDFLLMEAINSRIKDLYRLDYEILSKDEIP